MKIAPLLGCVAFLCAIAHCQNTLADLVWVAGTSSNNVYREANWLDTSTGAAPPRDSVNPNQYVLYHMYIDGAATPGGPSGTQSDFLIGETFSLTLSDTVVWHNRRSGVGGTAGGGYESLTLNDSSQGMFEYVSDIHLTLNDSASVSLADSANSLIDSTVDFSSTGAVLVFENETIADVISEHLGKFTVGGQAAVLNYNIAVTTNGSGQTIVHSITPIPEPQLACLFMAAVAVGMLRRHRHQY